jgi:NAD(P)-dependent dehydrogenase (short-subunit alcohol dehydrogenase family)
MGQIGGVSSSYGWTYRVSKAALNMAVAAAQNDYPRATLLAISPGWVQTDMGGASASLTVQQSVSAMRKALAAAGRSDATRKSVKGQFINYDGTPFSSW